MVLCFRRSRVMHRPAAGVVWATLILLWTAGFAAGGPGGVSPAAFARADLKDTLACGRGLGLEPIPLLQTIGHCEYVLQHDKYKPLAEVPDRIDQYCPRHPEVVPFLEKWIGEYLEVFGNVRYFHLGADEAYTLGECPL